MTNKPESIADDLLLGAEAIANFVYGSDDPKRRRDIYRNVFGFSLFKHGNTIAALKSTIRAELVEMQQAARVKKLNKEIPPAAPMPKRRRHRQAEATA